MHSDLQYQCFLDFYFKEALIEAMNALDETYLHFILGNITTWRERDGLIFHISTSVLSIA